MAKYGVTIPITGSIYFEVEAESGAEAIKAAWAAYGNGAEAEDIAWEATARVTSGNVSHAMVNEQFAQKLKVSP